MIGKNAIINDAKGTIVGELKDFHNQFFHTGIDPLCITTQGDWYNRIAVKINPSDLRHTLEALTPIWKEAFPDHVYEYDFLDEQIARLLLIAFVIAAPVAWWIMNSWLENFVYRINIGAGIFVMAVAITSVVATLTVGYRALKAALMNPVKSLRTE